MKYSISSLLGVTAILLTFSVTAHADPSDCMTDSIHCAYVSGLPRTIDNGRYIKLTFKGASMVDCVNYTNTTEITPQQAPNFIGKNQIDFSICPDNTGTNCQSLESDVFIVNNNNGTYSAEPKFYNIDLSQFVKDPQYHQCTPMPGSKLVL
ncbi:MAG: hypothetical protein WBE18_06785 [Gammaproteobacteria bacterium]